MINNFEEFTDELNDYERTTLLPVMVKCFKKHVGEENAIKSHQIKSKMEEHGYDISDARIRKIVHAIRQHSLVPCLVATSKGYFVADKVSQVSDFIDSLQGREYAICAIKEALIVQRDAMREKLKMRQPDA